MRELTIEEMNQVDGGAAPLAFALEAGTSACSGWRGGGPGGAAGAAFRSVLRFHAEIAVMTTGAIRFMYGTYSFGSRMLNHEALEHLECDRGS